MIIANKFAWNVNNTDSSLLKNLNIKKKQYKDFNNLYLLFQNLFLGHIILILLLNFWWKLLLAVIIYMLFIFLIKWLHRMKRFFSTPAFSIEGMKIISFFI